MTARAKSVLVSRWHDWRRFCCASFDRAACRSGIASLAFGPLLFFATAPSTIFAAPPDAAATPAATPPEPLVNRSLPQVAPPSATFSLPASASTADLQNTRLFAEGLTPVGGVPSVEDNAAVAAALKDYASSRSLAALERFVGENPRSPWRVSVLTNLGLLEFQDGYFSRALADWTQAWETGKSATEPPAQAVVNRAAAELLKLTARVGRLDELKTLLGQMEGRPFRGLTATMIAESRRAAGQMELHPDDCFKCGPFALSNILTFLHQETAAGNQIVKAYATTAQGTSLAQVSALADRLGLKMQAAKRLSGTALPLPALVNWKLTHYGALLREEGGRYLLVDPTFGTSAWVRADAVASEASGYFLIPAGPLPAGWTAVGDEEARTVWGRGQTPDQQGGQTGCGTPKSGGGKGCGGTAGGMPQWMFDTMLASLNITDTPLVYQPPLGPEIAFSVNYDATEQNQPSTVNYSNLGPLWNFSWLSTITFDSANAYVNMGGGGYEDYVNFNATTQSYDPDPELATVLVKVAANDYERRASDGSKMVFALADPSGRLYLTRWLDPQGNAVTYSYDANFRLVGVTDAIGQVTTLAYGSDAVGNAQFYLIAKVTDPFGRFASFAYNAAGQLAQVTDTVGMSSQFTYDSSDFIKTLTTPYGATNFTLTRTSTQANGNVTSLLATEPNGAQQRIDAVEISSVTPDTEAVAPAGMPTANIYLEYRNSYFWDRQAMHDAAGDYTRATLTHFLHYLDGNTESGIVESEKKPLESRVWYFYENQNASLPYSTNAGMIARPTRIGRIMDDGGTQLYQYAYNAQGKPTGSVDPLGRTTNLTYASNGIDPLTIMRVNGSGSDLLATFTWNNQHEPLTTVGADGETTTYTYNAQGQPLTITDAKNEQTTATYDSHGFLTQWQGPVAGAADRTSFTYNVSGQVQTMTNTDGDVFTYAYDALNRPTLFTYPDGTTERIDYTFLLPTTFTDRLGHTTTLAYNGLLQLVSLTDHLGRMVRYERCSCGALLRLVDPLGQATTCAYDVESRPVSKTFPDGSSLTYTYTPNSDRLASATDESGQTKAFIYNPDNTVAAIGYSQTLQPTASVAFTYDPAYVRVLTMADGIGTTTYAYYPVTGGVSPGAGQVATVTGPWNDSQLAFTYDALGRLLSRAVNGVAQTVTYDALGRIPTVTNALGAFTYTYENGSNRVTNLARPDGSATVAGYFGNTADRCVQQLRHLAASGAAVSEFDYTYDAVENVRTWGRSLDGNPAVASTLSYDVADQLTGVSSAGGNYAFTYDAAGNRATQSAGNTSASLTVNALNEVQQVTPALGNDKTYLWDAEKRLVGIGYTGTNRSTQLSYDGLGRCAQIVEVTGASVTSTRRFVYSGMTRCEEHDAADNVTRRFFNQGEQIGGANYFYTFDHLGSIREMTDPSGAIRARYAYDPSGARTKVGGDLDASPGFAGLYYHAPSSLQLASYRAYDASTGRWISRDPLGEAAGTNAYSYAENNPATLTDPSGLCTGYVGVSGGVSLPGAAFNLSVGLGYDNSGNIVPFFTPAKGIATSAGAAIGVTSGFTTAPTIFDTGGASLNSSVGGGAGGLGGSLDGTAGKDHCGHPYGGFGTTLGFATPGLGATLTGSRTHLGKNINPFNMPHQDMPQPQPAQPRAPTPYEYRGGPPNETGVDPHFSNNGGNTYGAGGRDPNSGDFNSRGLPGF